MSFIIFRVGSDLEIEKKEIEKKVLSLLIDHDGTQDSLNGHYSEAEGEHSKRLRISITLEDLKTANDSLSSEIDLGIKLVELARNYTLEKHGTFEILVKNELTNRSFSYTDACMAQH